MRWWVTSLVGLSVATGIGCRNKTGIVEAQLRAREIDVRELREELDRAALYNQALQNELHCLRGDPVPPGTTLVERPVGLTPVRSIALGRQTGGRGDGSCAGDDCLHVQIEPRDPEGQAIKVAGTAVIQVFEITPEGVKRPLSSWEIGQEQLRRSWRNGLLSTGYMVKLPWKIWPSTEKLRVVAQFKPIDGRLFEAEKDITIHLPPVEQRRALTPDEPATAPLPSGPPILVTPPTGPALPVPPEGEPAPPPRPIPPGAGKGETGPDAAAGPTVGGKPIASSAVTSLSPWRSAAPRPAASILPPAPNR